MKNILFAASECVPFIKTGGLADVVGSLPKYFDKKKYDVRVVLPKYSCMNQKWKDQLEYMDHFYMNLAGEDRYVGILKYVQDGITFYFIDNEYYFNGFAPYDGDPRWNIEKFAFFLKGCAEYPAGDRLPSGADPLSRLADRLDSGLSGQF